MRHQRLIQSLPPEPRNDLLAAKYARETTLENDLDAIWRRLGQGEMPLTEREFLALALWAYHVMLAERVQRAAFALFEHGHAARYLQS